MKLLHIHKPQNLIPLCLGAVLFTSTAWASPIIPNDTRSNFLRGNEHLENHEYEAALEDFNKALYINTDHIPSLMKRALIYEHLGYPQAALKEYNRIIALNSGYAQAYLNRAKLYLQEAKHTQARQDLNTVLSQTVAAETYAQAYTLRGLSSLQQDHLQNHLLDALNDFNRAIYYNPKHFEAYVNRGQVYEKMGQLALAFQDYELAYRFGSDARAGKLLARLKAKETASQS